MFVYYAKGSESCFAVAASIFSIVHKVNFVFLCFFMKSNVGKLVTDFSKKTNIFNNFFASIYTPIDNTSCLPSFSYRTGSRIKCFQVTENDLLAIIKTLVPNEAHGCDNISIKIIKIWSHLFYRKKLFSNIFLKVH